MSYLIHTDVFLELAQSNPDKNVIKWFECIPAEAIYMSTLSIGEVRAKISLSIDLYKQERMRAWLEHELFRWLGNQILPIDIEVALYWGRIQIDNLSNVSIIDQLVAATAIKHCLSLVTNRIQPQIFESLEIISPWISP